MWAGVSTKQNREEKSSKRLQYSKHRLQSLELEFGLKVSDTGRHKEKTKTENTGEQSWLKGDSDECASIHNRIIVGYIKKKQKH